MKKTNIARLAVTAGLTLAMGAGMMAPATVAFAADTDAKGSITITQATGNDTTFDGYQIFKAAVKDSSDPSTKSTSDIQWASEDVKTVVEAAIKHEDSNYAGTNAQDAADFIKNHFDKTDSTTAVDSNSFAKALADALENATLAHQTFNPGQEVSLDKGYWLFVTTPSTVDEGKSATATAPIFAVVGGSPVTVSEKDTVPTVQKTVGDGNKTAGSAGVGKVLNYHLTGTVASDVATYQTYQYKFTDTLSAGLDYNDDSAVVKIDGVDVTDNAGINCKDNVLTVDLGDLKADYLKARGVNLTKDTQVTVDYSATVNTKAVAGSNNNNNLSNSVTLTYSNDPRFTDKTGTSKNPSLVKEYTYKLKLIKKDRITEQVLPGAVFTLMDEDGNYIKADGTKATNENDAHLSSDANGKIEVNGLDEGTYTLDEVTAPEGYDKTSPVTIKISATIGTSGNDKDNLTQLSLKVSGNDDAIPGESDGNTSDNKLTGNGANASDVAAGTVTVTVGDKKEITMPLTGMKGTTALMVYGSAILAVSAAAYLKHKRNASNDDAE